MEVAFSSANAGWFSGINSRSSYRWGCNFLNTPELLFSRLINIYSNPGKGVYFLSESENLEEIRVFDIAGCKVFKDSGLARQNSNELRMQHLLKGMYQLMMRGENGISVHKILIE